MKKLYIDCRSGISGDMTLGAFLDLGVPLSVLEEGLASMGLNEFTLDVKKKETEEGILVTDVDVVLHDPETAFIHPYSGDYWSYGEIKEMIDHSNITSTAKEISRKIFDIKATAESLVHNVPEDEVRFHEAGAVDSIVDVVGTAICLDHVKAEKVVSCSVPTGFGTIKCTWGELPVPPPAVKAIIDEYDLPHYRSDVEQELLTPTGASILTGIVDEFIDFQDLPGTDDALAIGRRTGKRPTGLPPLTLILKEIEEDKK